MNIQIANFRKATNYFVALFPIALIAAGCTPLLQGAASTFTITPALNEPIGVAYSSTANKLLFSQPFNGKTNRRVMGVTDAGVSSVFGTLPDRVTAPIPLHADAWEDYIAVSPGLGGFTKGAVFVTQGQNIVQIAPTGGAAAFFINIPGLTDTHTGIAFDDAGTFGYQMILTGQNGNIYAVTAAGVATLLASTAGFSQQSQVAVENGQVAPLSWGLYGGWFIVGAEDNNKVFAVNPVGTPGMHQVIVLAANYPAPETVRFIPTSPVNWGVSGGIFFDIIYSGPTTKVIKFPASDFGLSIQGQALIPHEDDGIIQVMNAFSSPAPATAPTLFPFASNLGQQEGSTFVTVVPSGPGCTLTQGGYKNHFNSKVTALFLGGTLYSASQVNAILQNNAIRGNGALSLAHQLITAKLNVAYGASIPPSVALAIVQADQLLATAGGLIPPAGNGYLPTSATSSVATILDDYNNGITGPGHCE